MSASLISRFYQYLSEGKNKIEALQLAKLDILNSSDPLRAHPFFWAGYINIGDYEPLYNQQIKKPNNQVWAILLATCILLVIPLLYRRMNSVA